MAASNPMTEKSPEVTHRLRADGKHYDLASAGILAPEGHRILLSAFIGAVEAEGDADIVLCVRRDRTAVGELRLASLCGATGGARWTLGHIASSVIDLFPAPGPQVYLLTADVSNGAAVVRDAQLWPSILDRKAESA